MKLIMKLVVLQLKLRNLFQIYSPILDLRCPILERRGVQGEFVWTREALIVMVVGRKTLDSTRTTTWILLRPVKLIASICSKPILLLVVLLDLLLRNLLEKLVISGAHWNVDFLFVWG